MLECSGRIAMQIAPFINQLENECRQLIKKAGEQAEYAAVLSSDDALAAFLLKSSGRSFGPFMRASTYTSIAEKQDLWSRHFGNDPRRPVVMRGAKVRLQSLWSRKSDWAHSIADRYLRMIRFTAFTRAETDKMREIIAKHMRRRGHYVNDPDRLVRPAFCGHRESALYLDGEHRWVAHSEYRKQKRVRAPTIVRRGKRFELRASPAREIAAPVLGLGLDLPKLSLVQKRRAAYLALKELGINI